MQDCKKGRFLQFVSFLSNQVTEDQVEVGTRAKLLIRQVKEISTRLSLKVDDNTPTFI